VNDIDLKYQSVRPILSFNAIQSSHTYYFLQIVMCRFLSKSTRYCVDFDKQVYITPANPMADRGSHSGILVPRHYPPPLMPTDYGPGNREELTEEEIEQWKSTSMKYFTPLTATRSTLYMTLSCNDKEKVVSSKLPLEDGKELTLKIILPSLDEFMLDVKTKCEASSRRSKKKNYYGTMQKVFTKMVNARVEAWKFIYAKLSPLPNNVALLKYDWVHKIRHVIFESNGWDKSVLSKEYGHLLTEHIMKSESEDLMEWVKDKLCVCVDGVIKEDSLKEWINDEAVCKLNEHEKKMRICYDRSMETLLHGLKS
jgi:hypothetical protein